LPFFSALGSITSPGERWQLVSAGLIALRAVDTWLDGSDASAQAAMAVVDCLPESQTGGALRRLVCALAERMSQPAPRELRDLRIELMEYMEALLLTGDWTLALCVLDLLLPQLDSTSDADLIVLAHVRAARCWRELGDVDHASQVVESLDTFAAAHVHHLGSLRARHWRIKLMAHRGNLCGAAVAYEALASDLLEFIHQPRYDELLGFVLHDHMVVAGRRGLLSQAIELGYEAAVHTVCSVSRDRILSDIAKTFYEMREVGTAADIWTVLAERAAEASTRLLARVNSVQCMAHAGDRVGLQRLTGTLERVSSEMSPYVLMSFRRHVGTAAAGFGEFQLATTRLATALQIAETHGMNEEAFAIRGELEAAERHLAREAAAVGVAREAQEADATPGSAPLPAALQHIARHFHDERLLLHI
jgi:hypothetical protein